MAMDETNPRVAHGETRPLASPSAGLMGRDRGLRRVPLSFAPEPAPADRTPDALCDLDSATDQDLPEVMRQVARLSRALGVAIDPDGAPDGVPDGLGAPAIAGQRRVAFTLRIDPVRHAQLRQIVGAQAISAQRVLIAAFDQYCAASIGSSAHTPSILSFSTLQSGRLLTGKQP